MNTKPHTKPYDPDDAIKLCGDESKRDAANLNQSAGPAFSLFLDKKVIACGGVRIYGIAELWMLTNNEYRKKYIKEILRASKEQVDSMIRENHLWRVMAERNEADAWLKHLGFEMSDKRLYTR